MSAADMADGELDFEEFSAWFLKQEGLPDGFEPPEDSQLNFFGGPKQNKGQSRLKKVMSPFSRVTKKVLLRHF